MWLATLVLLATGVAPKEAIFENGRTFAVALEGPSMVRVSPSGAVFMAEMDGSRVVVYSETGAKAWEQQISVGHPARLVGLDLDKDGKLFVLDAAGGEVHIFQGVTGRALGSVLVKASGDLFLGPGALAADEKGGFYVLNHAISAVSPFPIHHFDSRGNELPSLGPTELKYRTSGREVLANPGWIGRGPDRSLYYRRGGELVFYRFGPEGQELATIKPSIPYTPRSETIVPGDFIGGTEILDDGGIACEIIYRTSYERIRPGGPARTHLRRVLYLINADGSIDRVLTRSLINGPGVFTAAAPAGRLFFLTPDFFPPEQQRQLQEVILRY